jgi:hypothetical protein
MKGLLPEWMSPSSPERGSPLPATQSLPPERRGRSSLRKPNHGLRNIRSPSILSCFIGEAQSSKKSAVQTHLLGNNCFCLRANCPGIVYVVELDRVLTSPCFDFPLYSIEKRRIVKCSKCFYISSLQAHKLNSIGKGRLPVVKLDRAPNTDVLKQANEQGALFDQTSSTRATRPSLGHVKAGKPTRSIVVSTESASSSPCIDGVDIGLSNSMLEEGDPTNINNPSTLTTGKGPKHQPPEKMKVSIVERHNAVDGNHEESKRMEGSAGDAFPDDDSEQYAARIFELIGSIKQTGDEDEARQIARVIRTLQEREAWFQEKWKLQAQVGGCAMEPRGDDNDARLQPLEWLFVKSNEEGATSEVSGLHSTDNYIANDPPTSTLSSSRHGGGGDATKKITIEKMSSKRDGSNAALASGSETSEPFASVVKAGGGLSPFQSRGREDKGRPALHATTSDLIHYIARVSNEPPHKVYPFDEPESHQSPERRAQAQHTSDPPIDEPLHIRLPQEPCGAKGRNRDPKGRRRRSAPSLSSKLTNPHRKNPHDDRLGVGKGVKEIEEREPPEVEVIMEPEECREPDARRSHLPLHHANASELQTIRMLASMEMAAAHK